MRRILSSLTVACLALGVTVASTPSTATAAFSDCSLGVFGGAGEWCLWSNISFAGTRNGYNFIGPLQVQHSSRSHANRFTNRCIRLYGLNNVTIVIDGANTGHSFSRARTVYGSEQITCS